MILVSTIPLTFAWILLGFSQSFPLICMGFAIIGFSMGLKESPTLTFVSEISDANIRGALSTAGLLTHQTGFLVVFGLGLMFSWRQIAFICALFPISCFVSVLFVSPWPLAITSSRFSFFSPFQVPESPAWLLSQNRHKDAERALQWLRGWVSRESIQKELLEMQNYCMASTACSACSKQAIKCEHPKSTLIDKIKELKRKRTLKPISLVFLLYFFFETCIITVLQPYLILVLKAYGMQIDANKITVLIAVTSMLSSIFLITTVTKFGRRPLYLASSGIVIVCSIALSECFQASICICSDSIHQFQSVTGIYGFILFPPGWTTFGDHTPETYKYIRQIVGNYSYLALALILLMQFAAKFGVYGLPNVYNSESFPMK